METFTFPKNPNFTLQVKPKATIPRAAWAVFRKSNLQISRELRSAAFREIEPTPAPEFVSDAEWARRLRGRVLASYAKPIPLPTAKCPECSLSPTLGYAGHLYSYCCGQFYYSATGEPVNRTEKSSMAGSCQDALARSYELIDMAQIHEAHATLQTQRGGE